MLGADRRRRRWLRCPVSRAVAVPATAGVVVLVTVTVGATALAGVRAPAAATAGGVRLIRVDRPDQSTAVVMVSTRTAAATLPGSAFRVTQGATPLPVRVAQLAGTQSVAVAVDTAGATPDQSQGIKNAVAEILLGLPGGTRVSLVTAAPTPLVLQTATADQAVALDAVSSLASAPAGQGGRGGLVAVLRLAQRQTARSAVLPSTVIVVSTHDAPALGERDRTWIRGGLLYAVTVGPGGRWGWNSLTASTGGLAVNATAESAAEAADDVVADLASQYQLRVRPIAGGPRGTRIDVQLPEGAFTVAATLPEHAGERAALYVPPVGGSDHPFAGWTVIDLGIVLGSVAIAFVLMLVGTAALGYGPHPRPSAAAATEPGSLPVRRSSARLAVRGVARRGDGRGRPRPSA